MKLFDKIKKFFSSEEDLQQTSDSFAGSDEKAQEPEQELNNVTGEIKVLGSCAYCQKDITSNQRKRYLAAKLLHKKCYKMVLRETMKGGSL